MKKWTFSLIALVVYSTGSAQSEKEISDMIAAYKYPVNYAEVNDSTSLAYVDVGDSEETLIFIHGLATYLPSWHPVLDSLKGNYRCIAIDLPNYGRSSKGDYPADMDYYSKVLLAFMEDLEISNPILVGHSMGGQIAITTVLKRPEAFEKLILLAPAGFETFNEPSRQWLKQVFTETSLIKATEQQIRSNWALNFHQMPDEVEFMIQDRLKMKNASDFEFYCRSIVRGVHGMLDQPVYGRLPEIRQKTLVVYGENDALIPNKYLNPGLTTQQVAETGSGKIPGSSLVMIPECGHFISFDKPAEISEIIGSFLTKR